MMHEIKIEEVTNISPQDFFTKFVHPRQPCKLSSHTLQCDGMMKWKNFEYLKEKCGKYSVRVERRNSTEETYGNGYETDMLFEDFVTLVKDENEKVYVTTQELLYTEEGLPSLFSPPIDGLLSDFDIIPNLMGNLLTSNLNLWMGYSSPDNPSSSRLHHDFHDNLYILLKGEKKILLYHFDHAPNMYTVGTIDKIHKNGRINYVGQRPTNADGTDISSNAAHIASLNLDKALKKLVNIENCDNSVLYDEIDDEVDKALEGVLDAEIADNDFWDEDDYDDDDDDDDIDDENSCQSDGDVSENVSVGNGDYNHKRKSNCNASDNKNKIANSKSDPNNFSLVDLTLSDEDLKAKFPLFYSIKNKKIEVTLKEGEGLFIPAGWFHEVKSSGTHMAFNYWFHPCGGVKYCCYETPYGDNDFWLCDWLKRLE